MFGHGCARTTHAATVTVVPVLLSSSFECLQTEITYAINLVIAIYLKNNHLDNNEPLCPDHKTIRLQIMPTNAVTCSLDPDLFHC